MAELKDLTPEQRQVVETWGQGLAVLAGAGSGKTTTLVIKCEELLNRNPEARFAAVSFTERSASDLREKLSIRLADRGGLTGQGSSLSGHWVSTIHGLCGTIIREYPREAGFDGDEVMLSQPESSLLWERAMESLWLDELPEPVQSSLDRLLARENRGSVMELLKRSRDLQLFGILDSLRKSEDPSAQALDRLSQYVLERYDRLKKRRGALDFNDLERGADRALDVPEIRAAFHKRFELVMIDEFQDTNPVQARILWRFVRPDLSNLCVVGDPKQSIYRFRDADVSVFEACCAELPVRLSLTWNFRSRPGIIEFSNQVCAPAFDASKMQYVPLVPKREVTEKFQPVVRLNAADPKELAAWVVAERDKGVPLHDMALLLRKIRGGNEKWLKALTQAGIPIAVGSGGFFWEDPRVREMAALLKWWANPANSYSGAVFLRSPWVGMTDAILDQWVRQDPTWQKPFFASGHPIARALKSLRDRGVVRPGEILMALLIEGPEGEAIERELGSPLLGLWHRVEELSARGLDLTAVIDEISMAMAENRRERDVPPPRNLGQLSVLTLHASKGLEFPHVILVDFTEKPGRSQTAPLLFWDREQGAYLGKRTSDGERDKKDPIEKQWCDEEKRKELAESKRLFYVALTRAQERLVLVCPACPPPSDEAPAPAKAKKKETIPVSAFDKDHWLGWIDESRAEIPLCEAPRVEKTLSVPVEAASAIAKAGLTAVGTDRTRLDSAAAAPLVLQQRPRHSVTEWNTLARCPRAYEWSYIRPVAVNEGIPALGIYTGAKTETFADQEITQRELGTRVHACLERGDFDALKTLEAEVGPERFLAEPVISWAMSSPLMSPVTPQGKRGVWTELAFEVPVQGLTVSEVVVGSIDRLVREETANGVRYSIVDFKVTEKLKSVDSLLEAYRHQLEIYAWALGALEPESRGRTDAVLVNISSRTIQTVPVNLSSPEKLSIESARVLSDPAKGDLPADPLVVRITEMAQEASRIVNGAEGRVQTGPLCRVCEFRSICREGTAYVT